MLRLAYYADDFTGSTDALEQLARAGLRTALFLDPPTPAQLAAHGELDALGVAGLTRSLAPEAMAATLRPAFTALRNLGARHVHYKVCSTFDSAPHIGSIGCAIDTARVIFAAPFVPVLAAAPALGRYTAFGQHFARYGIGSAGAIHRLDRHPAISKHPVTPMTEADLRRHLAPQTDQKIGLVDLPTLHTGPDATLLATQALIASGHTIILYDAVSPADLLPIAATLEQFATATAPLFSVGSSGIEHALCAHWSSEICRAGSPDPAGPTPPTSPSASSAPLLVLSGSCSPVTAEQIAHATAHGFTSIALDPTTDFVATAAPQIVAALSTGQSVIAYTSTGATRDGTLIPAQTLGTRLGALARSVLAATAVDRLVIAGGDTSSYAARALGIESLTYLAPLSPGAPWCRASAPGSPADTLAVNFKGGQVGAPDYFVTAAS